MANSTSTSRSIEENGAPPKAGATGGCTAATSSSKGHLHILSESGSMHLAPVQFSKPKSRADFLDNWKKQALQQYMGYYEKNAGDEDKNGGDQDHDEDMIIAKQDQHEHKKQAAQQQQKQVVLLNDRLPLEEVQHLLRKVVQLLPYQHLEVQLVAQAQAQEQAVLVRLQVVQQGLTAQLQLHLEVLPREQRALGYHKCLESSILRILMLSEKVILKTRNPPHVLLEQVVR